MALLIIQILASLLGLAIAVGVAIRLAYPLPPFEPRIASNHLVGTSDTPLGRGVQSLTAGHAGLSGIHILADGREAFAARVLLARAAERSLDVQYYIWHADQSGTLMLEAMREAADRGVRVRMLLDDNGIAGLDPALAALNLHPNVEIRLFNPFVVRRPKVVGYLADFRRLNRRMHNKSLTADNQATIIGGRNIGDEYFSARDEGLFLDMDVLTIGPAVEEVSQDFDRYWSSKSAYPAEKMLPLVAPEDLAALAGRAALVERDAKARSYVEAIRELPFIEQVLAGTLSLEWAKIRMVSDDPAKGLGAMDKDKLLTTMLHEALGNPVREISLISGYFVPTQAGVDAFSGFARSGVQVSIVTNAFEATDVWVVHAGYAERREALLRAGIRLFEMRRPRPQDGGRPHRKLLGTGSGSSAASNGHVLRSSGSTLHAKTFAADGERLFIGSFNFDPRSMHLNTELGFVIESPALAAAIADAFETDIPARAYEVRLTSKNTLNWHEQGPSGTIIHSTEPGTNALQRAGIRLLSRLPIEWLL